MGQTPVAGSGISCGAPAREIIYLKLPIHLLKRDRGLLSQQFRSNGKGA
jgi:hypothetical protein